MKNADANEISRIIQDLVQVCVIDEINAKNLPYFDIEYLFLQIRAKSIGEVVDVNVNCKCGNQIKTSYSIDDLIVEKSDKHTSKIQLDANCGLIMKYPNINDAIRLFEDDNPAIVDDLIINSIEAIYDGENYWSSKDLEREKIQEFLDNLQKKHFDMIEQFFITSPQILQVIKVKCDKCDTDIEARLKGLYNFFV